ncbi:hypothetical protein J2Y69_002386 [Microbacterium resistens]|uniref:Protein ImuA n=1 Tax=Microbacterium resistens TaxID=156977 RepID=A0ABU1SDU5_9MICO|nr:hypothetical protein [Microbacterium resistens]MDR6867778.1 hypothetical protein [Microbacterium resistens]
MGNALHTADPGEAVRAGDILRLRQEITRMQRRRSDLPLIPLHPALAPLLPEGGLQVGAVYGLSASPGLVAALLASASRRGSWCAAVGMPTLGVEALAGHGVDLSRLILVPEPGSRWLAATSALSEVVPLIAVRPSSRVRDAEVSRLTARLRDRGCTLLVASADPWPQSEGRIRAHDPQWNGLGTGWGLLEACEVTVTAQTRRSPVPRSVRVRLPDNRGMVEAAGATTTGIATAEARTVEARTVEPAAFPRLRAVGG